MKDFEKLQNRLNLIPRDFYLKSPEGYKLMCNFILQEEGWTEEEYMGIVISRIQPDLHS